MLSTFIVPPASLVAKQILEELYKNKITFLTFELFWANLFSQYLSIRHQDDMTHHCILSQSEAQFTCALALSAENNVQV